MKYRPNVTLIALMAGMVAIALAAAGCNIKTKSPNNGGSGGSNSNSTHNGDNDDRPIDSVGDENLLCGGDGQPFTVYPDQDLDGFGVSTFPIQVCMMIDGLTQTGGDCDDMTSETHPLALEILDGRDNDCDTQIDEGYSLEDDVNNCGAIGNVCSIPNANATCQNGRCAFVSCQCGYQDLDGSTENGCESVNPVPVQGSLVITELMPHAANYDSLYEYVEIYNNSGELLNISSLQLVDGGGNTVMISDQQLAAGATFLIARPGLLSRGIVPNITHDGGLSLNNRGESVRLVYNGQTIDEITYHSGWPYSAGHALTLDPSKYDTELNDEPSNWCASPTVYSVGSDATEKFSKVVD